MADKTKTITIQAEGIQKMRSDLDSLKDSLSKATDPEDIKKFSKEVIKAERELKRVNETVSTLADNSDKAFGSISGNLKGVGSSIKNLDFGSLLTNVNNLSVNIKKVDFKSFTTGLKAGTKASWQLVKSLLANPIVLIGAAIAAVIVILYKIADAFGYVTKVTDILSEAMEKLSDWFNKLSDRFFGTSKVAEKEAQKMADAYKEAADEMEKSNNKIISNLDHQIKMAELNGESTVALERQKIAALRDTAIARKKEAEAALEYAKLKGKIDKEEIKELEEKLELAERNFENTKNMAIQFETKVSNDRKKANEREIEDEKKKNIKLAEERKKAEEKRLAKEKQEAADRLSAQRLEEDLELQLMEEGDAKLLKQNQLTYERLIEDAKSNEKLNAEEKERVIKQYQDLSDAKAEEIRKAKKKKEEDAATQAQEELSALLYDLRTSDEQKVLDDLDNHYEENINKLRENLEKGLITKEEFAEAEKLLAQEKTDKIEEIERKTEEAIRAEKQATLQANLDTAATYASAVNDLAGSIFEISNNLGDQDEKEKEKRAKKQFAVQKALNLVMAGIDGARAITTSLASAPLAIGPIPNPAGIASLAAVAVNTAATMAAIASKQYTGSGGGGGSPVKPKTDIGSSMTNTNTNTNRMIPNINFQGTGAGDNKVNASGGSNQSIVIDNKVSISETEVTDKQKTVANLSQMSKI